MEGDAGGGGKGTGARAESRVAVMKLLHEDGAIRVAVSMAHYAEGVRRATVNSFEVVIASPAEANIGG